MHMLDFASNSETKDISIFFFCIMMLLKYSFAGLSFRKQNSTELEGAQSDMGPRWAGH